MNVLKGIFSRRFAASLVLTLITAIGSPVAAHALTPANGDFEAETVTSGLSSKIYVKSDSSASAGKDVKMTVNGTISKTVTTPTVSGVVVTASGSQCNGAPVMTVKIDGTTVLSNTAVTATSFNTYSSSAASFKAGSHQVSISFSKDLYKSSTCDRNLYVDKVEFKASDTTAPAVLITAPVNGATVKGDISVRANATDAVGVTKVEFYLDSATTPARTETGAPYCLAGDNGTTCNAWSSANVADGYHTLTVKAYDTAGNVGTATNGFTVSNAVVPPPSVSIASVDDTAASGSKALKFSTNGRAKHTATTPAISAITVTARGEQCSGAPVMTVKLDGSTVLTASVSATTYTTYKAALTNVVAGNHTVAIEFANDFYQPGTCDRNLLVDKVEFTPVPTSGTTDTTKPVVSVSTPANGSTVTSLTPVQAVASDNIGVTKVEFYLDNATAPLATSTVAPYCMAGASGTSCNAWDSSTVSDGTHTITAKAYDAAGNNASASSVFTTNNKVVVPSTGSSGDGTIGTVVKNLDFQTGDISQWSGVQRFATDRFQVTAAPTQLASTYKYAARVEIRDGDTVTTSGYTAARSEVYWGGDSDPTLTEGKDYYFGWSTMFDSNFPSPGTSTSTSPYGHSLFIQWKNTGTGSPPLDLEAINNKHQLGYGGDFGWGIPLVRGGRTDWVVHVKFSTNSSIGFVEIWERAPGEATLTKKLNRTYKATLNAGGTSYLKLGYYRKLDETKTGILWDAGMKVGTGFASVDPTK